MPARRGRCTDQCVRASLAAQVPATARGWGARWRRLSPAEHLPRRGRRAARRGRGRGAPDQEGARRARPAAAAPRTTTRTRRPARGQRARRGPGPCRDRNMHTTVMYRRARHDRLSPGYLCSAVGGRAGETTRMRARCHTATGAALPSAHDRARTLFRERRSAPPPPPARSALPILREIAGGR